MPLNYAHGYYKAPKPLVSLRPGEGQFTNFGTDTPPSITDVITVINNGASTPVALTLDLAVELTIQTAIVSHGNFDGSNWTIASLGTDETATLEIYSTTITPLTEISSISYNLTTGTDLAITTTREEALTPDPGDIQKLWLSAENACGYTEISSPVEIIFSTTDALEVTLPTTARSAVTGFLYYHLAIGDTLETATRIYRWQAYDNVTGAELPLNPIILSRDAHLEFAPSVATPENLPTGPDRISGQTRLVIGGIPTSAYYLYDPNESEAVNGETIVADSAGGKWTITIGTPVLGLVDPFGSSGCAQIPTEVDPQTVRRSLITLNETTPVEQAVWTRFHYVPETPLEAGSGLQIAPFLDNKFHPGLFKKGIKLRFMGYIDLTTGALIDTNPEAPSGLMSTIGEEYIYDPFFPTYELETPLEIGVAAVFEVTLFISKAQLGNEAGIGSLFSIDLRPITLTGIPALWGYFSGDLVFNTGDKLRVFPDGTLGTGHAIVARETHPPTSNRRELVPLTSNTVGIQIVINGSGDFFIRNPDEDLPETESLRALISLETGYSEVTWSESIEITSGSIKLTRTIPNYDDVTDTGTIKTNYPTIGGMSCEFNVDFCKIFVFKDSLYYELTTPLPLNPTEIDEITITTLDDFTLIPSLSPNITAFFDNPTLAPVNGTSGDLPNGTYQVGFAYYYSGDKITSINHSVAAGCIPEMGQSLDEISKNNSSWGKTYASTAQLQLAPTANIPQFHQAKVIINNEPIDVIFDHLEPAPDYPSLDRQIGGWTQKDYGGLLWALVMGE